MTASLTRARSGAAGTSRRPRHAAALLATVLVAQFMAVLDVSVVNVAAPAVGADLGASGAALQLVVSGYTMTYAVLLVGGARLGDRWGHGRAFRAGLVAFTVMSLLCGLAPTTGLLIACRFLQGVGAALMMPQVMSLIQRTFDGQARARALGLYGAVIALGAVAGQVLGGVLVGADVAGTSWRPTFLINVPIGIVLLVVARRALPSGRGDPDRRLDGAGTGFLAAAVLLFVVPLVLGHELGWPAWCFVSLGGSALAFAGFAAVERRVDRRGGTPIVSRRVLRAPGLLPGAGAILLNMATYGGFLFSLALYLQQVLGYGPAHTGLLFAPAAAGFAIGGLNWHRLPARWHGPMIPIGFAVAAFGYLGSAAFLNDSGGVGAGFVIVLVVLGFALGVAYSPVMGRALQHVDVSDAADASGVLITTVTLGQVVGVAVFGTLYLQGAEVATHASHAAAVTVAAIGIALFGAAALAVRVVRPRPVRG